MATFPHKLITSPKPQQISRAFNELLDWLRANQALPGQGIVTTPTDKGLIFNVKDADA